MTCQELIDGYAYHLNLSQTYQSLAYQEQNTASSYYMQAMAQGCFSGFAAPGPDPKLQEELAKAIDAAAREFLKGWNAKSDQPMTQTGDD